MYSENNLNIYWVKTNLNLLLREKIMIPSPKFFLIKCIVEEDEVKYHNLSISTLYIYISTFFFHLKENRYIYIKPW